MSVKLRIYNYTLTELVIIHRLMKHSTAPRVKAKDLGHKY